jgi:hypothetical protein
VNIFPDGNAVTRRWQYDVAWQQPGKLASIVGATSPVEIGWLAMERVGGGRPHLMARRISGNLHKSCAHLSSVVFINPDRYGWLVVMEHGGEE